MTKTKSKAKTKANDEKKPKPLAQIIDEQVMKGGKWDDIVANVNKVAGKRDNNKHTKGSIKAHINYRLASDKKYYGKLTMTEDEVKVS